MHRLKDLGGARPGGPLGPLSPLSEDGGPHGPGPRHRGERRPSRGVQHPRAPHRRQYRPPPSTRCFLRRRKMAHHFILRSGAKEGGAAGLPFIYNDAPFVEGVRALKQSRARRLLVLDQATDAPLALLSYVLFLSSSSTRLPFPYSVLPSQTLCSSFRQSSVVSWALRHIKHLPADVHPSVLACSATFMSPHRHLVIGGSVAVDGEARESA
jgi:hypothetical protein